MNVNIEELRNIQDRLEKINEDDVLFIDENGQSKYAVIDIQTYEKVEDILAKMNGQLASAQVKIIGPQSELSYEEYERIKATIMDAVEKTFRPKAGKLN